MMRSRRFLATLTTLLAAMVISSAPAQSALRIDGQDVGPSRTYVAGTSYAPLSALAGAMGVTTVTNQAGTAVALSLGGHVVTLQIVPEGSNPAIAGAMQRDGAVLADLAAVRASDGLWVPVAATARAFFGSVGYLASEDTVVVVTKRPRLQDSGFSVSGTSESLTLTFDAPVATQRSDDPLTGAVEVFLPRAVLDRGYTESGALLARVGIFPDAGGVRVRVEPRSAEVEVLSLSDGSQTQVVVRARRAPGTFVPRDETGVTTVAIEAGFVTETPEARAALLALAEQLAARLGQQGIETVLVRTADREASDAQRLQAAVTSDLYLLLHETELPASELRIWTLGEASIPALVEDALRRNVEAALANERETETLRRELLLGLVPDVAIGQRAAETLSTVLFQRGNYRTGPVQQAPLAVLAPAAGRGLLIEFGPEDLSSREVLVQVLAEALADEVLRAP